MFKFVLLFYKTDRSAGTPYTLTWFDNIQYIQIKIKISHKLNIILLDIFKFSCYENEIFVIFLGMILILYQRIRVLFF